VHHSTPPRGRVAVPSTTSPLPLHADRLAFPGGVSDHHADRPIPRIDGIVYGAGGDAEHLPRLQGKHLVPQAVVALAFQDEDQLFAVGMVVPRVAVARLDLNYA